MELLHEVEAVGGEDGEVGHQAAVLPIRDEDCGHVTSCPPTTAHLGAGAGNVVSEGGEVLHDEVVSVVLGLVAQPPQNLPA